MSFALGLVAVLLALAPHVAWAHGDHEHEEIAPSAWPAPCPGGAEQCGCRAAAVEQKPVFVVPGAAPSSRLRLATSMAPARHETPSAPAFSCFAFSTRAPPASS